MQGGLDTRLRLESQRVASGLSEVPVLSPTQESDASRHSGESEGGEYAVRTVLLKWMDIVMDICRRQ